MSRIVSVHQPNFIPWMGLFDKIVKSDVFVVLDEVQIPRGKSPANRNFVKTANGKTVLTVPLSHPKGSQKMSSYHEVNIAEPRWHIKALRTIEHAYSKAPYFEDIFPLLAKGFLSESFFEMNYSFLRDVVNGLGLDTHIVLLSDLPLAGDQKNNEMIISICKELDADTYLSGQGARSYNDPDSYGKNRIDLIYQEFEHPKYEQINGEFIANLSIVDALFNIGFESTAKLLTDQESDLYG